VNTHDAARAAVNAWHIYQSHLGSDDEETSRHALWVAMKLLESKLDATRLHRKVLEQSK